MTGDQLLLAGCLIGIIAGLALIFGPPPPARVATARFRRFLSDLGLLVIAAIGWASLVVVIPLVGFVDLARWVRAELARTGR